MEKKLIVPGEVRICATCSYWDGDRHVDEEYNVVVVAEECRGECLVQEKVCEGMNDVRHMHDCAWEPVGGDDPESAEPAAVKRKVG